MWVAFRKFLGIANFACIVLVLFIFYNSGWAFKAGATQIEYKDFLSLILTALSLMIAVLGAGIAIMAVYGYQEIRREARDLASNTASEVAQKYVTDWLSQKAPGLVREHVELIKEPTISGGEDGSAADSIGESA